MGFPIMQGFQGKDVSATMKCPSCGSSVSFTSNAVIYGKVYGNGLVYICNNWPRCDSFVGAHFDATPLGTLADGKLRRLRGEAHRLFDELWKPSDDGFKTIYRHEAYNYLANYMQIPVDQCHIGMFDAGQCIQVIEFMKVFSRDEFEIFFYNQVKNELSQSGEI